MINSLKIIGSKLTHEIYYENVDIYAESYIVKILLLIIRLHKQNRNNLEDQNDLRCQTKFNIIFPLYYGNIEI